MSTIFTRGKLNEIYFKLGKFEGDVHHKHTHAPLHLLTLDGVLYLSTSCFKAGGGLLEVAPWVSQQPAVDEEYQTARDIFPIELNPVVLGQHELGDWQGHPEDWRGMHRLGLI